VYELTEHEYGGLREGFTAWCRPTVVAGKRELYIYTVYIYRIWVHGKKLAQGIRKTTRERLKRMTMRIGDGSALIGRMSQGREGGEGRGGGDDKEE